VYRAKTACFVLVFLLVFCGSTARAGGPSAPLEDGERILVVTSYHKAYEWQKGLVRGIESVLAGADIRYVDLDTKLHYEQGPARAKEAFDVWARFKPRVVIATDDNAQSMFVVPYLLNKVDTPVVFCGVNDDASKYGYPGSNVTGVIERTHYGETISFARLILPDMENVVVLYNDNPTNQVHIERIRREKDRYAARISAFISVATVPEALAVVKNFDADVDAILSLAFTGIKDADGRSLEFKEFLPLLNAAWGKPVLGTSRYQVEHGALCAVAKSAPEQGRRAAEMVRRILDGTPVASLPLDANRTGRRVINVFVARSLGISLPPPVLLGTDLVN